MFKIWWTCPLRAPLCYCKRQQMNGCVYVCGCMLTCGKLALHLLEHRVLGSGLSSASQRLGGSAGEHGGDIGDILQAHSKRAHQLLHKVQCVWCNLSI